MDYVIKPVNFYVGEGAETMDWTQAGAALLGGYLSSGAKKKAVEAERRRALADRAMLTEEAQNAASEIRKGANPLFQQANRLELQGNQRNSAIEQSLAAGLRNQAGGIAAQGQAQGLDTTEREIIGAELMRGQGLLAAETQRINRFTELTNLSANLRGQGAQVLGNAAQTRLAGMQAVTDIKVVEDSSSAIGTALTAFGSS
jgi:hypothetical protein